MAFAGHGNEVFPFASERLLPSWGLGDAQRSLPGWLAITAVLFRFICYISFFFVICLIGSSATIWCLDEDLLIVSVMSVYQFMDTLQNAAVRFSLWILCKILLFMLSMCHNISEPFPPVEEQMLRFLNFFIR